MARIDLPGLDWLVNKQDGRFVTNTYSGSLGTLPATGCVNTRTFNYRVYADIASGERNKFRLIAESYIIQPWHPGGRKTDFENAEFECSDQGAEQAGQWLATQAAKYGI